jgi:hypothetical protein
VLGAQQLWLVHRLQGHSFEFKLSRNIRSHRYHGNQKQSRNLQQQGKNSK